MVETSERERQLAVRQCLARCYEADAPLSTLASFAQRLKEQEGWPAEDVREVEVSVLRLLAGVMGRERERPLSEGA